MVKTQTNSQLEYQYQVAIAEYLLWQYPGVLFRSDLGGIKLTMGQAVKVKRLQHGRAWLDMFIAEPRRGYHGLFGEIKISADEVYTKKGELRQDRHIMEQHQMICRLRELGYKADFWCGFDAAKEIIDWYLDSNDCPRF